MTAPPTSGPPHPHNAGPPGRCLAVAVQDFPAVERVVSLLRGRRYDVAELRATPRGDGGWTVAITAFGDDARIHGLFERLRRMPAVTDVQPR